MAERQQGRRRPRLLARAVTVKPGYWEMLPRERESAAVARELVRAALDRWGLTELVDDAALVVTELVANAVDHAPDGATIRVAVIRIRTTRIRISVVDGAAHRLPPLRAAGPDAERGRGLLLVEALSDQWGVDLLPWGKRVRADLEMRVS
ncbi:ATP-binding protein [Streptomyces lichenis]|uniref:ATP-binding protein n=1 Tax=Streptomyces lichenis TaxID=2306967 RepID=A0ABT0I9I8_9ACTN|nr:ATP-binding protein [Streptomyces lichenis]MCK8677990.1 ATP-binding protein [Streptomyces lichenis]